MSFREKNHSLSLTKACKALALSRAGYYKYLNSRGLPPPRGRPKTTHTYNLQQHRHVPNEEVLKQIEALLSQKFVLYGYKKVAAKLKREGYLINHKKVYRLMKEKDLLLKEFRGKRYLSKRGDVKLPEATAPDQKWSIDIKYAKAANGERGYVIAVKDSFTKEVIALEVSPRRTAREVEKVLYSALANRNYKELPIKELYVVSDNGKEIIRAMSWLKITGIRHVRITPRSPWENGEIESFFSCLEREVFGRIEVEDFEHMKEVVSEYVEFYNTERIHGGIGYKTPREKYLEYFHSRQEVLANVG